MIPRYYFIDWDSNGEKFLENIHLTPQVQANVHIYIVYRGKDIPPKLLPHFRSLHVPRNAKITAINKTSWEPIVRRLIWKNPRCSIPDMKDICLVSTEPKVCFSTLMELLTSKETDYRLNISEEACILNEFEFTCDKCRMVFASKKGLKQHDTKFCGYFEECLTHSGKRRVGFFKSVRKVKNSSECTCCLGNCVLTYSSHRDRAKDMEKFHKSSFVGKTHRCESIFDNTNYSSHFLFGYDVLPCLAVSGCPRSFSTLQEQAHHHVTEHGCIKPYFCMVCYRMLKTVNFDNESELLFHGRLEGHCEADFCFPWVKRIKHCTYVIPLLFGSLGYLWITNCAPEVYPSFPFIKYNTDTC